MNKQKEFAKISVLIDKLNYLNDNLDYNNFNPNNVDFLLLKKYVDEIQTKLNEIGNQDYNANVYAAPLIHDDEPILNTVEEETAEKEIEASISDVTEQEEVIADSSTELVGEELIPHQQMDETVAEKVDEAIEPLTKINEENIEKASEDNGLDTVYKFKDEQLADEQIEAELSEKKEIYDLYELNDGNSEPLTKVSDIVDNIETEDGSENIQQDIIATINAIKGGNQVSAIADNTRTNFAPKTNKNLDSIIVDKVEDKIDNSKTLQNEKVEKNGMSFLAEENEETNEFEEDDGQSLNDLFKDKKKNVADAVVDSTVKRNLKDIIDINDRFQFIQSLFGGSYLGFEEAVGTVSKQRNYSEALDFIDQKLKSTYNWDSDSKVVEKFLTLVEKCYQA